jgi:maleate isomerase
MPDLLGYRAKIGVVVPSTNTTMEPELHSMAPPGVTAA